MDVKVAIFVLVAAALLLSGGAPAPKGPYVIPVTDAEVTLLARLIDVEAGGEPFRGKLAVGAVVVNRVKDRRFPNTVRDVIYEPKQFYTAGLRRYPTPSDESRRAAIAALRGEDPTRGALFFYNPDLAVTTSWWASRPNKIRIGRHVFSQ